MLKKNKILAAMFFIGLSYSANAIECKTYKTRYINKKSSVVNNEKICITKFGDVTATSENCTSITNKKCPFKGLKKSREYRSFVSEIGSPGFNLCHYLEGSPQIYEIQIEEKWKPFERCYFKKSVDFVDIDGLIRYYLSL
jgi:hypothetical protein